MTQPTMMHGGMQMQPGYLTQMDATLLPNEPNRQALQKFFETMCKCDFPSIEEAARLSNACGSFTLQQVQLLWEFFYHKLGLCATKVMAWLEKNSNFGPEVGVSKGVAVY